MRDKDDVFQVWNSNAATTPNDIVRKIYALLPEVQFIAEFYRGNILTILNVCRFFITKLCFLSI